MSKISSVWEYFTKQDNGKKVECKVCKQQFAYHSSTTNMAYHLKTRKHQAMYNDFVKRKDMKREGYFSAPLHTFTHSNGGTPCSNAPINSGGGAGGEGTGGERCAVMSLTLDGGGAGSGGSVAKFDKHDPRQVLISEAIAKMIVVDLQPMSIVENQGFRELLHFLEPRYTLETQHCIQSQLLPAYTYQVQMTTHQALAQAQALSLSLDLWRRSPGATAGYLGVTCHFLTSDWQMRSALLACLPLTASSSGNHVLSKFKEVCHSHSILNRTFRIIADRSLSTANTKPCCLPGFLLSPGLTNDNDDVEVDNGNSVEKTIRNGHGDSNNGTLDGHWEEALEQGLDILQVSCFAHSLDQCVRDGLHSCPQISSTLAKAAGFYNYITKAVPPEKLGQVFDRSGITRGDTEPGHPGPKDWASQLKVLNRLLDSIELLEEMSSQGEVSLTVSEKALLKELTDTLEPFTEAWDMMHWDTQKDAHVSISLVMPCVLGLRKHLSETAALHCSSLVLALSHAVERRLSSILEDPLYIIATTLDPQFKLTWSSNPDWHTQVLLQEISKYSTGQTTDLQPQSQTPRGATLSPASTLARPCKLFSFIKQRPASQAKSLEQELTVYLQEEPTDEEALHYWQRKDIDFPLLAQVAKNIFTVPACETVVRNVFAMAERQLLPERGHILPKNLETLIYLKANSRSLWT